MTLRGLSLPPDVRHPKACRQNGKARQNAMFGWLTFQEYASSHISGLPKLADLPVSSHVLSPSIDRRKPSATSSNWSGSTVAWVTVSLQKSPQSSM